MVSDGNNRIDWLPMSPTMTDIVIFTLCSQLKIHHASKLGPCENCRGIPTGVDAALQFCPKIVELLTGTTAGNGTW